MPLLTTQAGEAQYNVALSASSHPLIQYTRCDGGPKAGCVDGHLYGPGIPPTCR